VGESVCVWEREYAMDKSCSARKKIALFFDQKKTKCCLLASRTASLHCVLSHTHTLENSHFPTTPTYVGAHAYTQTQTQTQT